MRRIAFQHTQQQILAQTKTVTRRLGWAFLDAGIDLLAVDRNMGMSAGERAFEFGPIRVTRVHREPLHRCDDEDATREGFTDLGGTGFVRMFCDLFGCSDSVQVTRIEFRYLYRRDGPAFECRCGAPWFGGSSLLVDRARADGSTGPWCKRCNSDWPTVPELHRHRFPVSTAAP